jgi:malonyl CoA-acyl carrier protein transacylase
LDDSKVEEICASITSGIVVPANYNCPGQLVISGEIEAVNEACEKLKAAGAKRALVLQVGGAFHSPLMKPAEEKLANGSNPIDSLSTLVSVNFSAVLPNLILFIKGTDVLLSKGLIVDI